MLKLFLLCHWQLYRNLYNFTFTKKYLPVRWAVGRLQGSARRPRRLEKSFWSLGPCGLVDPWEVPARLLLPDGRTLQGDGKERKSPLCPQKHPEILCYCCYTELLHHLQRNKNEEVCSQTKLFHSSAPCFTLFHLLNIVWPTATFIKILTYLKKTG